MHVQAPSIIERETRMFNLATLENDHEPMTWHEKKENRYGMTLYRFMEFSHREKTLSEYIIILIMGKVLIKVILIRNMFHTKEFLL